MFPIHKQELRSRQIVSCPSVLVESLHNHMRLSRELNNIVLLVSLKILLGFF